MRLIVLLSASLLTAAMLDACTRAKPAEAAAAAPNPVEPPYNADIDVDEVMVHVMDPAARAFWAGWGEVYDRTGRHDVSASTDEEWKKVEDGAAMVVLATNTLMLPTYRRKPEAEWNRWVKEVAELAIQGKAAADKRDLAAIESVGGKLDEACDACHKAFRPTGASSEK
jgi:hypothetical protein